LITKNIFAWLQQIQNGNGHPQVTSLVIDVVGFRHHIQKREWDAFHNEMERIGKDAINLWGKAKERSYRITVDDNIPEHPSESWVKEKSFQGSGGSNSICTFPKIISCLGDNSVSIRGYCYIAPNPNPSGA
jgi:hypothetical protein